MKSNIKLVIWMVSVMVSFCGLSSCSSDHDYNNTIENIATVQVGEEGYAKSFTLDNGKTLYVSSSLTKHKPVNERVVISYWLLEDKPIVGYDDAIKLNGYLEDVLTKPIIYIPQDDAKLQDSIGHNEIKVFSMWAKADYITIRFEYNMAGKGVHMLNLVSATKELKQDGDKPIKLEFRHNITDDAEHYASKKMHVSFKLDKYIEANIGNENLAFEITWKEYDGTVKTEILKCPIS